MSSIEHLHAVASDVLRALCGGTEETVYDDVLGIVLKAFRAGGGFFGWVDSSGSWVGAARSSPSAESSSPETDSHPLLRWGDPTSVWRRSSSCQGLLKVIAAPLGPESSPIGWLMVADRSGEFTAEDLSTLGDLASLIGPVFDLRLQQNQQRKMWNSIQVQSGHHQQAATQLADLTQRELDTQRRVFADKLEAQFAVQRSLFRSERRYREIVDNTDAVIYVKRLDGRYDFVNTTFERLFHLRLDEIVGRNDFELFPEAMAKAFRANDERVTSTGQSMQIIEVAPHDDGPHTYVSLKFPLRDSSGTIDALAGISTDVTDRLRSERFEQELMAAREVQRILYPRGAPAIAGFTVAGHVSPAGHGCGDYLDYIPLPNGDCVVAVGDVSGHSLSAALQMVETRAYLRALLSQQLSPEKIIDQLNRWLVQDTPDHDYVELFFLILHAEKRQITYLGAGRNAWLLHNGTPTELRATGLPLGIDAEEYRENQLVTRQLARQDLIVITTDGVLDTRRLDSQAVPERFGCERLLQIARTHHDASPTQLIDRLFLALQEFSPDNHDDDVTAAIIRVC